MLQRTLLRSSRAIQSTSRRSIPPPLLRHQPFASLRRAQTQPRALRGSRWYSEAPAAQPAKAEEAPGTETESAKTAEGAAEADAEAKAEPTAEEIAHAAMEAKNKEIAELKDRYLRSVADFRNLQERTKREIQSSKDFALQRFALDLVDSVDNLDRALGTVPAAKLQPSADGAEPNADLLALYDGLKMTEANLMATLKKHGLERFDPAETAEEFDPNLHEATFMTPQEGKEDDTVFFTQQKGFMLNGRVLRAAKVGVVKNS